MKNNKLISISGKIFSGKDLVGNIIQWLTIPDNFYKERYTRLKDEIISDGILDKSKLNLDDFSTWGIVKFADKLKDITCVLIGCTREQLEDREFKEKELGEEWRLYKYSNNLFSTYEEAYQSLVDYYWYDLKGKTHNELADKLITSYLPTPRLFLQLIGTECFRNIIHPNSWVNATFSKYNKENDLWILTDTRFPNELKAVKDGGGISIRVIRPKKIEPLTGDITTDILNNTKNFGIVEHESERALDKTTFDYEIINDGSISDLVQKVKNILIAEEIIKEVK